MESLGSVGEAKFGVGKEVVLLDLDDGLVEKAGAEGPGALEFFVDVAAATHDFLGPADRKGGELFLGQWYPGDAVEGGLHGPGGDAEGLEVVGADAEGHDDGDEEDFDVFLDPSLASVSGEGAVAGAGEKFFGGGAGFLIAGFHGGEEVGAFGLDVGEFLRVEDVALVVDEFLRAFVEELGFFFPLGGKHEKWTVVGGEETPDSGVLHGFLWGGERGARNPEPGERILTADFSDWEKGQNPEAGMKGPGRGFDR